MPTYEVIHRCDLTNEQRDALAAAITEIHAQLFTVSKIFVNVWFRHWHEGGRYVGGQPECNNCIRAFVRGGPARSREQYVELVKQVRAAWYKVVPSTPDKETFLHVINVMDSIAAGMEFDFWTPPAGGDVEWFQENWKELTEKAKDFPQIRRLVDEVRDRGLAPKL
ncbi:uncharacterized protein HMPREF1541_04046 [Cyphellophora europaea CBS 101466]|uniref:Tautomerase cis-CaaD-like domain-containing protein n=1 Tax=Cyphellophora europaea (strain CBS 101466) TaxID=1220924 RepID=W2S091_CYPE1|nr:uncharacterized protein HMPREF1541_04046 [Cyphellophora europaea CBS 101466]ETN42107.1 hypothetical protein HMPREF1541_04046 [Cyphellophora europaea CBS 101466]